MKVTKAQEDFVLFDNFVPLAELSRLCHSDAYHLGRLLDEGFAGPHILV